MSLTRETTPYESESRMGGCASARVTSSAGPRSNNRTEGPHRATRRADPQNRASRAMDIDPPRRPGRWGDHERNQVATLGKGYRVGTCRDCAEGGTRLGVEIRGGA